MGADTKIEWCHATFNPWRGCAKISAGCANCYAETLSHRNPGTLGVWGPKGTRVIASDATWREPLKWDRAAKEAGERHRVFCASLADVFEDWQGGRDYPGEMMNVNGGQLVINDDGHIWSYDTDGPPDDDWGVRAYTMDDVRQRLFDLILHTPHLDWLVLTKRPENALRMMVAAGLYAAENPTLPCPQRNLWLGTSVENRAALSRIDLLRRVPAAVRFLSLEPLLEDLGPIDLTGVHWVIVGGESGSNARPCNVDWVRSIMRQCRAANVPVFVKQLGSNSQCSYYDEFREEWENCRGLEWPLSLNWNHRDGQPPLHSLIRLPLSRKGGLIDEWPADLRVREFPLACA